MIIAKKFNSIHEIEASEWNAILDADDIFHQWEFIRAIEDSKVENSDFWYLLFYDNHLLIGSAVLSAFAISLDLFIGDLPAVKKLKKLFPNLFQVRILICGLPASFGQLNIKVKDEIYVQDVCSLVGKEMRSVAKANKIRLLSVKEFCFDTCKLYHFFVNEGFFVANSIPYMTINIRWNSFNEYLLSLRHPYRRRILQALQKIGYNTPGTIPLLSPGDLLPSPALVVSDTSYIPADEFYQLYLQVMERAEVKLETLNNEFFVELFKNKEDYRILSLVDKGKVISSAILVLNNQELTFMLVAREFERDAYDSYFNLVYGIINYAIENGFKKLNLGQTAYWVKQSVGALPEDRFMFFGSTNPVLHFILKSLNKVIFPGTKFGTTRVFKSNVD